VYDDAVIRSARPFRVEAGGLVLREWAAPDRESMVDLFDDRDVDRWTPLESPFTVESAFAYIARAHRRRREGFLQLAITEDGDEPLGEVLLLPAGDPLVCEIGYVVGPRHRSRALAARAVKAVLPVANRSGYREARLSIAVDNHASQRVAVAAGFEPAVQVPVIRVERKGYLLDIAAWTRQLPMGRPKTP
jgi:RimJ/RimL family protein N-acetyltransferase